MNVGYRVDLSQAERDELSALVSRGKRPVRRLKRMQILLAADAGVSDEVIAATVQPAAQPSIAPRSVLWRSAWRLRLAKSRAREQLAS